MIRPRTILLHLPNWKIPEKRLKGVKAGQSENEMLLVDADGNVLMVLSKN
jgi:hypothetical protein